MMLKNLRDVTAKAGHDTTRVETSWTLNTVIDLSVYDIIPVGEKRHEGDRVFDSITGQWYVWDRIYATIDKGSCLTRRLKT